MKIVGLIAENVKKLSVVEIRPKGNLVQITGKNGQGKTSVLDAIWWAMAGTSNIQSEPIRKDADEARIVLDLGEIVVRRTFKRRMVEIDGKEVEHGYTTSIVVENVEGARFPSPQRMLDGLLGQLSIDPLAFASMDARAQFETLKRFVPGVDFEAVERQNQADYQTRTDVNRRAKEARANAGGALGKAPGPVDEAALVARLEEAGKHNAEIETRKARRAAAEAAIKGYKDDAAKAEDRLQSAVDACNKRYDDAERETEKQIEQLKERLGLIREARAPELTAIRDQINGEIRQARDDAAALQAKLDAASSLPEPIDTSAIRAEIAKAADTNKAVADYTRRKASHDLAEKLEGESKALTKAMEKREAEKRAAIAAAKLPVAGIEFGAGHILLNGLPFDQASDAEKLRASVSIAMAMHPKLRVVRVRDGSLLDDDGLALLATMADEADCQVWLERVDSTGKVGFVLENGALKSDAAAS